MLNNVVLIGHIVSEPTLEETNSGKDVTTILLAVARSFKNIHGVYETDYIHCKLWAGIAKSTVENCQKGSLIAVKGRLQTRSFENSDGKKINVTEVIAERVSFLK